MRVTARRGKWAGAELNRRHADFQSAALPTELPARASVGTARSGALAKGRTVTDGSGLFNSSRRPWPRRLFARRAR